MAQVVVAAIGGAILTYYFTSGNKYDSAAQVERDRSSLDDAVNSTVNRGAGSNTVPSDRRSSAAAAAALGEVVVKEVNTLVDYIVRDFVRSWYKLGPSVGGYISSDEEFLEHATFVLRHVLITFAARMGQLNPIEVLSDDVATACSYHMRWHSEMVWRASAAHPRLFQPLPNEILLARAKERLGPAADLLPQEQLLEEERHVSDAERDAAITEQYLRAGVLHEACQSGLEQGAAGPDGEETQRRAEWHYLRRLAAQLLPELLPECEQGSTALSILLREILTTCVFQPSLSAVHPHAFNGWLLTVLRAQGAAAASGPQVEANLGQSEPVVKDGEEAGAPHPRPSIKAALIDDFYSHSSAGSGPAQSATAQEGAGLLAVLSPVFQKAVTRQVQTESSGGGVSSDLPPEMERRLSQSEVEEGVPMGEDTGAAGSGGLPPTGSFGAASDNAEGVDGEAGGEYSSDEEGEAAEEGEGGQGSFNEDGVKEIVKLLDSTEAAGTTEEMEPGDEYGGRHVQNQADSLPDLRSASKTSLGPDPPSSSGRAGSIGVAVQGSTRTSASLLKDQAWAVCKSNVWLPLSSTGSAAGAAVLPGLQNLRFNPLTMFHSKSKGGPKADEAATGPKSPGLSSTPTSLALSKPSESETGALVSVKVTKASVSFEKDGPAFDPKAVTRYALSIRMAVKHPQDDSETPVCTAYWKLRVRYSEFYDLHQAIKKYVPDFPGCSRFPPKVTLTLSSQFDEEFVEKRKAALDSWLQEVLAYPALRDCAELRALLCPRDRSDIVIEQAIGRTSKSSLKGDTGDAAAADSLHVPKHNSSGVRFADSESADRAKPRGADSSSEAGRSQRSKGGKAGKKVTPALEAARKAQRQRQRQATAVGRAADVASKPVNVLLTPTELAKLESRAFGLLSDLIDLNQQNWLHRHVLGALRHLVRLLYHGAAAETLAAAYKDATSARSAAHILRTLHSEVLWPGGKWGEAHPLPTQADIIAAKRDLLQSLLSALPPTAHSFIGKDMCDAGVIRLWAFLQCPVAVKSLLFTLVDLLLARAFPGIAVHGLSRAPPKIGRLPTPGMYGFVEEAKPQDNVAASVMAATVAFGSAAGAGASAVATGTLKTVGAVTGVVGGAVVSISATAGRSLAALAGNTLVSMGIRAGPSADASPPTTARLLPVTAASRSGLTASPSLSSAYASTASVTEHSIAEAGSASRRSSILAHDGVHGLALNSPAGSAANSRKASIDHTLQQDSAVPSSAHPPSSAASAWSGLRMSPVPSITVSLPAISSMMSFPKFNTAASPSTPPAQDDKDNVDVPHHSSPGQSALSSSP